MTQSEIRAEPKPMVRMVSLVSPDLGPPCPRFGPYPRPTSNREEEEGPDSRAPRPI